MQTSTLCSRYRDSKMINYDPDVRVMHLANATSLVIDDVRRRHSGNYTCQPSPLTPSHVVVHVISDEEKSPAAVYDVNSAVASAVRCQLISAVVAAVLSAVAMH